MRQSTDYSTLNTLLQRYYDGLTSLDEERRLRQLLSDPSLQGENIDGARAVIGYFATAHNASPATSLRRRTSRSFRRSIIAVASSAAAAAILLTVSHGNTRHDCMTYIGSALVNDHNTVMSHVAADLRDLAIADEAVAADIAADVSDLSGIFDHTSATSPTQSL